MGVKLIMNSKTVPNKGLYSKLVPSYKSFLCTSLFNMLLLFYSGDIYL